jgi:hypothetical protein
VRIYEGSARQDFEEVLRSVGAFLDQRGMREILLTEAPDGFIVQGIVPLATAAAAEAGQVEKETLTFLDDDITTFMDEALARRRKGAPQPDMVGAGRYEQALRVLGRYIDQQKPRDVFFFEQDGSFVVRLLMATRAGSRHVLAEFTADEIREMIRQGPAGRQHPAPTDTQLPRVSNAPRG